MILDGILIIGIEIKCGMIGLGVIQAGILGVLLIDGLLSDMIDGDIIYTMVGIIMAGDMETTTDGMVHTLITITEDGHIMVITFMESQVGEAVEQIHHILMADVQVLELK
tara:strand:- start:1223 stop:1552 length:330 start_codon:yes stop_codon:yes gene_type:complete